MYYLTFGGDWGDFKLINPKQLHGRKRYQKAPTKFITTVKPCWEMFQSISEF